MMICRLMICLMTVLWMFGPLPGRLQNLGDNRHPAAWVDPFIGTRDMGHCYPGATVPFGMVQISPETDAVLYRLDGEYNPEVYRYCSGYQYDDATIVGFSHTFFSGTGHSDLGDFRIMPMVGDVRWNPGDKKNPGSGYRSRFSHDRETAVPGYYAVHLDDYGIKAEMAATERVGFFRFGFPAAEEAHIILDMTSSIYSYKGKVIWASLRVENDTLVTGSRQTRGWARNRILHFAMAFSKPVKSYSLRNEEEPVYKGFWRRWDEGNNFPERAGKKLKGLFSFRTKAGEEILVKVALSAVSPQGAMENLKAEIPHWNFSSTKRQAEKRWNTELSKITIQGSDSQKRNFYTALYHSFLSPVVYSDVDGRYRGLDQNIHQAEGYTHYTIFSLWDTFRALHPLFTLVQPRRTDDMIRSMLAHYDQSVHHILPIWSFHANETWCMIGYHAVPVIADAYLKEVQGYDAKKALEAVLSSADYEDYDGVGFYRRHGYVPEDEFGHSASKTLEYAYDDWTIYRLARAFGDKKAAAAFRERAASYRKIFDAGSGFMRARNRDGSWKIPFDPLSTSGQGFIEGNAWNYSFYVPHDIQGLIDLLGGRKQMINRLDSLFTMTIDDLHFTGSEDITRAGIIGNYVHGNEPSHHIPYLYVYAGAPWKTQERVHQIVRSLYRDEPGGLCGNDDCGQMSAWYIFSC
ncbi:MAG: GH92 family glycosyl hydrolase, partial [Candidatus Aminicenantes bacterium]|nr:GH92 family glycosyl hydrolase [Candidatus Aminicenantes bacterium]